MEFPLSASLIAHLIHSGPPARPTRPRAGPAARRALAGSARVSVEGAGTGEHHMPALPSKGKSRDLSVAALIPVSADGVVKRLGSPDEEQYGGLWAVKIHEATTVPTSGP